MKHNWSSAIESSVDNLLYLKTLAEQKVYINKSNAMIIYDKAFINSELWIVRKTLTCTSCRSSCPTISLFGKSWQTLPKPRPVYVHFRFISLGVTSHQISVYIENGRLGLQPTVWGNYRTEMREWRFLLASLSKRSLIVAPVGDKLTPRSFSGAIEAENDS